jgi:hypothetical protein
MKTSWRNIERGEGEPRHHHVLFAYFGPYIICIFDSELKIVN